MSTSRDVRAIRERSMGRMRTEADPDRAVAYALAGLWDAVELLSRALDADEAADPEAREELERLVRSLPVRLTGIDDDALATAAVAEHLAEVLAMPARGGADDADHVRLRRRGD